MEKKIMECTYLCVGKYQDGIHALTGEKNSYPQEGEVFLHNVVGNGIVVDHSKRTAFGKCPGQGEHFRFDAKLNATEMPFNRNFCFQMYNDGLITVTSDESVPEFEWNGMKYVRIVEKRGWLGNGSVYQSASSEKFLSESDFRWKSPFGFQRVAE